MGSRHFSLDADTTATPPSIFNDVFGPVMIGPSSSHSGAAYRLGRVQEARGHLEASLDLNTRYWPTLLNLGILEAEQGHKVDAIRHFNELLALDPGASATAEASYRLAEIYVSLGKRDEAMGHLRTAVVRAPGDPWGKKSEAYLKLLR